MTVPTRGFSLANLLVVGSIAVVAVLAAAFLSTGFRSFMLTGGKQPPA